MKSRFMIVYISVMFAVPNVTAQPGVHTSKTGSEILRLIRNEKLDLILPGAMRDNNVDMWIHVTRQGVHDPIFQEFGSTSGYLIFTDLGDRIERAVFGSGGAVENIDIRGSLEIGRAFNGYKDKQDPGVWDEISEFVAERDPKTIAVNTSDWLAVADGISYSQYLRLEKILGPKYSARIVSAENLITDFRVRRILREVILMTNAVEVHRQILERSLSNEIITPGVTTMEDVGWWVREQFFKRGVLDREYETGLSIPRVLYSAVSERIDPPNARWWIHHNDYVLQRGDFLAYDVSVRYLDYCPTDFKRNAYIMRKGETMNILVSALEDADYIRVPFQDIGTEDYLQLQKALANTDKSGFPLDVHVQGISGGGLVTVGPQVAPFRSDRYHLTIQENHLFALEFQVHTNLPERPGFPTSINIEGNHVVTSRGVEFLHPPNEKILLIH
jgi:Xaa-Pro dipeptidase